MLAIELSKTKWVLAAQVPGLLRVKAKRTIEPKAEALLMVIDGYRNRSRATGRTVEGHRSLIAGWAVKPSVQRLSGDECPCRVMVLSAVGVSRRMMVSEAPAS